MSATGVSWIDRLLTPRLQQRPAIEDEALHKLFVQVGDNDACLRAVNELLARKLLESAAYAGSHTSDDTLKLRSCERMECFRMLMLEIEHRRLDAKQWASEQKSS